MWEIRTVLNKTIVVKQDCNFHLLVSLVVVNLTSKLTRYQMGHVIVIVLVD